MRTPDEWTAGDYAISTRKSPVAFFRVVRVELVPDDPWPLLIPARCCSRCEELEELFGGRRADAYWFRRATRREIRRLAGVSFCLFRDRPRLELRVGACTRRLGLEELVRSRAAEGARASRASSRCTRRR